MPFVDGEKFQFNLGSWFVYPLFCVYVFNILFRKLLSLVKLDKEYLILALYLAIGIFSVQYCIDHPYPQGPMLLLFRTTFFLPCFQFGRVYGEKLEKHDTLGSAPYFAIVLAIQLVLLICFKELEYTPSKCINFKNGCVVPYITAVTGIAFWLRVAKLVAPLVNRSKKTVRLIADNTYSIMIHHMFGFLVVKWALYAVSVITPLMPDFNLEMLKTNIWYYYRPAGLNQFCIIYLAGGIFIPILIGTLTHKAWELIKGKLKRIFEK